MPRSRSIFITKPYMESGPVNINIRSVRSRSKIKIRKDTPCLSECRQVLPQQLPRGTIHIQHKTPPWCTQGGKDGTVIGRSVEVLGVSWVLLPIYQDERGVKEVINHLSIKPDHISWSRTPSPERCQSSSLEAWSRLGPIDASGAPEGTRQTSWVRALHSSPKECSGAECCPSIYAGCFPRCGHSSTFAGSRRKRKRKTKKRRNRLQLVNRGGCKKKFRKCE